MMSYRFVMTGIVLVLLALPAKAQRQMEVLGRGVVAVRISSTQAYVGWRMLGTDPDGIGFNVYRASNGGTPVKINGSQPITSTTDFLDTPPSLAVPNAYHVRPVIGGAEQAPSGSFTVPANMSIPTDHQNNVAPYLSVPLQVPAGGTTPDSVSYTYSPNDCSIGDLDGDGEYEYVLKWDPSNSKDNSQSGYTGNVYLDAYELDGTLLWRIDLGINIRAGAHYTQFMVYDLDGDGIAEVACKTAEGSRDGEGNYVANDPARFFGTIPTVNNAADHRNSAGYILLGYEFLTVFSGATGAELATTYYNPPRNNNINSPDVSAWGDNYGNRVDRFLAGVAYLDGVRPSLVMCRGYYTRSVLVAWDWRDGQLVQRWMFDSDAPGNGGYAGQGNHQLSVGDVDGDGKDEIVYGACSIDDDGTGLYTTGLHHGDALHLSDMDPDRAGIELWDVHEVPSSAGGGELRDPSTGNLLYGVNGAGDTGRGLAAHIDGGYTGYQMWSSATAGVLDRTGATVSSNKPSINFVVWWDEDLQRELQDSAGGGGSSTKLDKWTGNGAGRILSPYSVDIGARNNNSTKANPCLSGDLLGDWREEMMFRSSDNASLMIFVTPHPATNRFRTFLHDSQYRLALAWQNVAYNQPPHPGFYVGAGMAEPAPPLVSGADRVWMGDGSGNAWDVAVTDNWHTNGVWTNAMRTPYVQGQHVLFDLSGSNSTPVTLNGSLQPEAVKVQSPTDYVFSGSGSLDGSMGLTKAGSGTLTLLTTNAYTGDTVVWEGALLLNGRLDQSSVVVRKSVWLDSRIGGTGVLGQGAVLESGTGIAPGAGLNLAGTLTVSNALTQLGGVISEFDLSDDPSGQVKANDRIRVFGNLNVSGLNSIELHALDGVLTEGVYTLFEYTGTFDGNLGNFEVTGPFAGGTSLTNPPGAIALIVSSNTPPAGLQNLVWVGGASANAWDNGVSLNWYDGSGSRVFANGDSVTFDTTGTPNLTINLAGTLAPATVTVDSLENYTFTGSGSIGATGSLVKASSGVLTIAFSNSYAGGTVISNGTVVLGSDVANESGLGSGPVTLQGGLLAMNNSSGTWTPAPWDLRVPAGGSGQLNADSRCDLTGSLTGAGQFTFLTPWVRSTVYGDWSGFTGQITVIADGDGGDFRVANAAGFPDARLHVAANVFMYSRAGSGSVIPIGEFSADNGATVSAGSGSSEGVQNAVTWRVGGLNTDSTNAASMVGTTSLIKEGTGVWVLAGDNSYTGATTVNEGTLLINGSLADTAVTVTGGTLGGTGLVGGATLVQGQLAPGASVGTLSFGADLTLAAASSSLFEISKVPFESDRAAVSGTVVYGGTLSILKIGAGTLEAGDAFQLFDASGYSGGFAGLNLPSLASGLEWDASSLGLDGTIRVVSVAQPVFTGYTFSEGNLTFTGNGGVAGGIYHVLGSSDLALSLSLWTPMQTNGFDGSGGFSFVIGLDPNATHQFFTVEIP